ncbi:hypothetical protein [Burkholderia gladioli]|uniref:hypothetical protein n=1 Tax=Burkholderia gladioli TaxID=28095 RepID=UPI0012D4982A|nr:hypothetical protein [Burkholderia gladioli]
MKLIRSRTKIQRLAWVGIITGAAIAVASYGAVNIAHPGWGFYDVWIETFNPESGSVFGKAGAAILYVSIAAWILGDGAVAVSRSISRWISRGQ